MARFPKFRSLAVWLWSAVALITSCVFPPVLVGWGETSLPLWVPPVAAGVPAGLAFLWRRPGSGGAMLGSLLSAGGIAAVLAFLPFDRSSEIQRLVAAVLCPAGAVAGALVGLHAPQTNGRTVILGFVSGGVTGGTIAATYSCIMIVVGEFHAMVFFFSAALLVTGTVAGAAWGVVFSTAWCGCQVAMVRSGRLKADGDGKAVQTRLSSRIVLPAILAAAAWNVVLVLYFAVCLARNSHRLASLEEIETVGGHVDRSSGTVSLDENSGDEELPRVIELLNEVGDVRWWSRLDLSGSQVTGAGLAHMKTFSEKKCHLSVSALQMDEAGLANIGAVGERVISLTVEGSIPDGSQARIKEALPNIQVIKFHAPPESRAPPPTVGR